MALLAGVAPASGGEPPSAEAVRPAFDAARAWVDAIAVPHADEPGAAVTIEGASGVCVLLRRSGRVVGAGADWTGDEFMLRRAVARALGELLGEPAVHGMPEELRARAGSLVSIELEVAGTPEPLVASSFEHAGRQLDPGMDGIAMRREREWAFLFPAQLRATNTAGNAHRQFLALAADLKLPANSLAELQAQHNAAAYVVRATTLVQASPDQEPFVAARGEQVVTVQDVTNERLRDWASDAADHLAKRFAFAQADGKGDVEKEEPIGLAGTYNPLADQFDPIFAPPIEQALAAFALSAASRSPGIAPELQHACAAASMQILRDLAKVTSVETQPTESAATCAIIVAAMPASVDGTLADLNSRAIDRLMKSFVPTLSFDASLSPHERALVAWGLVGLSDADPLMLPRSTAEAAVEQAWESAGEAERVALLPWIGWAMIELAGEDGELAHPAELRELAIGLFASRVTPDDSSVGPDLLGGLPLATAARSHPTSQTLRPASWLASIIDDERLIPAAERPQREAELREIMRFVRQLMAREETAWRYRNRSRALGGFRAATWDQTQPVPAQALGVITLLEAAEAFTHAPEQPK